MASYNDLLTSGTATAALSAYQAVGAKKSLTTAQRLAIQSGQLNPADLGSAADYDTASANHMNRWASQYAPGAQFGTPAAGRQQEAATLIDLTPAASGPPGGSSSFVQPDAPDTQIPVVNPAPPVANPYQAQIDAQAAAKEKDRLAEEARQAEIDRVAAARVAADERRTTAFPADVNGQFTLSQNQKAGLQAITGRPTQEMLDNLSSFRASDQALIIAARDRAAGGGGGGVVPGGGSSFAASGGNTQITPDGGAGGVGVDTVSTVAIPGSQAGDAAATDEALSAGAFPVDVNGKYTLSQNQKAALQMATGQPTQLMLDNLAGFRASDQAEIIAARDRNPATALGGVVPGGGATFTQPDDANTQLTVDGERQGDGSGPEVQLTREEAQRRYDAEEARVAASGVDPNFFSTISIGSLDASISGGVYNDEIIRQIVQLRNTPGMEATGERLWAALQEVIARQRAVVGPESKLPTTPSPFPGAVWNKDTMAWERPPESGVAGAAPYTIPEPGADEPPPEGPQNLTTQQMQDIQSGRLDPATLGDPTLWNEASRNFMARFGALYRDQMPQVGEPWMREIAKAMADGGNLSEFDRLPIELQEWLRAKGIQPDVGDRGANMPPGPAPSDKRTVITPSGPRDIPVDEPLPPGVTEVEPPADVVPPDTRTVITPSGPRDIPVDEPLPPGVTEVEPPPEEVVEPPPEEEAEPPPGEPPPEDVAAEVVLSQEAQDFLDAGDFDAFKEYLDFQFKSRNESQVALQDQFTDAISGLTDEITRLTTELGYDPDERERLLREKADQDFDEAMQQLANRFAISPSLGGLDSGAAQRQAEIMYAQKLKNYTEISLQVQQELTANRQKNLELFSNTITQLGGTQIDAGKLLEEARQFDQSLTNSIYEFGKQFGLSSMQTEAVVRQIYAQIENDTRGLSATIAQQWAALTGSTGTPAPITAADLGVDLTGLPAGQAADLNSPQAQTLRASFQAMTGREASASEMYDLLGGASIEVDGAPTLEARQLAATISQQNMERVSKYDAIAKDHGLKVEEFEQAKVEADRSWAQATLDIPTQVGMNEYEAKSFRSAKLLYDMKIDEGLSPAEAALAAAGQYNIDGDRFLRGIDLFDQQYGAQARAIAQQYGMTEEQFEDASRRADSIEKLQMDLFASVMGGESQQKIWDFSYDGGGEKGKRGIRGLVPTIDMALFDNTTGYVPVGDYIDEPTLLLRDDTYSEKLRNARATDATAAISAEDVVQEFLANASVETQEGLRAHVHQAYGVFTDEEWPAFLVQYVDARQTGATSMGSVSYIRTDWFDEMDPTEQNAFMAALGFSSVSQGEAPGMGAGAAGMSIASILTELASAFF